MEYSKATVSPSKQQSRRSSVGSAVVPVVLDGTLAPYDAGFHDGVYNYGGDEDT